MSKSTAAPESPAIVDFKKKANRLKSLLKNHRPKPSLANCLEHLSKLEGARDWNTMRARLENLSPLMDAVAEHHKKDPLNLFASRVVKAISLKVKEIGFVAECPVALHPQFAIVSEEGVWRNEVYLQLPDAPDVCRTTLDLEITENSLLVRKIETNLVFPAEAHQAAQDLLASEVMTDDVTPSLYRGGGYGRKENYTLVMLGGALSSWVDNNGANILDAPLILNNFAIQVKDSLKGYPEIHRAFTEMVTTGSWDNKKMFVAVEDAIWAEISCGEPRYMAADDKFFSLEIEGKYFEAAMSFSGPFVRSGLRSATYGRMYLTFLQAEEGEAGSFWLTTKYERPEIPMEGISNEGIIELITELGIAPDWSAADVLGVEKEKKYPLPQWNTQGETFYRSNAFKGLEAWVKKNPQKAKEIAENGDCRWLDGWYKKACRPS